MLRARFIGICLLAIACPVGSGQEKQPKSAYYPLEKGKAWTYRAARGAITVRVVRHEKIGKTLCARIESTDGRTTKIEYLAVAKDGIYRYRIGAKDVKPPLCIFRLPAKDGSSWKVDSTVGKMRVQGTFKTSKAKLKLPSGDFPNCLRVSCDRLIMGETTVKVEYWFAPKTGIVKQTLRIGDMVQELILE